MKVVPAPGEPWRYKPNRGTGQFVIVHVTDNAVGLRDLRGKVKTVSLRTLRSDYEKAGTR